MRVAAAALPFLLYSLVTDHMGTSSEMTGLGVGLAGGLLMARGVARSKPAPRRTLITVAAAGVIALVAGVPLRGTLDMRPELARIAAVETRTAAGYAAAVEKFKLGRVPAKDLVQLIEQTIIPDLQGAREHLKSLRGVPRDQAAVVDVADQYFQLREQSWRDRAKGLVKSKMEMLRAADQTERAALELFDRLQPPT
jgi:hypothetical protein